MRLQCVQDNGCCELKIGMEGHHVLTQLDGVLYGAIGRWRAVDKLELELQQYPHGGGQAICAAVSGRQADSQRRLHHPGGRRPGGPPDAGILALTLKAET